LIEGFVSPSGIDYSSRIGVLAVSLGLWALYFFGAGHDPAPPAALDQPANSEGTK